MVTDNTIIPKTYTHCRYCELPFDRERVRTLDHFIPLSKGGKNTAKNLQVVCQYCNQLKGSFMPFEFIYHLHCKIQWKKSLSMHGGKVNYDSGMMETVKRNVKSIYGSPDLSRIGITTVLLKNPKTPRRAKSIKLADQKEEPMEKVDKEGVYYITQNKRKCPCVGYVDRLLGNGVKQYQNAYLDEYEDKYLFVTDGGIVRFYVSSIHQYIKPFVPKQYQAKIETVDDIVSRAFSAPYINFHYED